MNLKLINQNFGSVFGENSSNNTQQKCTIYISTICNNTILEYNKYHCKRTISIATKTCYYFTGFQGLLQTPG